MSGKDSNTDGRLSSQEEVDNPPAKNLRKNSGRNINFGNMATNLGDKSKSDRKYKKTNKANGKEGNIQLPSVKQYFNKGVDYGPIESSDNEREQTGKLASIFKSKHDNFTSNSEGEYVTSESTEMNADGYDFGVTGELAPQEDWSQRDDGRWESNHENGFYFSNPQQVNEGQGSEADNEEEGETDIEQPTVRKKHLTLNEIIMQTHRAVQQMSRDRNTEKLEQKKKDQKLSKCEETLRIVTGIVIRQDKQIQQLQEKVLQMEKHRMKAEMVITGIVEKKGENIKAQLSKFFKEQMQIEENIAIDFAYRLGKPNADYNRSVIIRLKHVADKALIYKHVKNIKKSVNADKEKFYVNDHLPEKLAELQRKLRQKIKRNKELIDAQQQDIKWSKGNLEVDGVEYQPKVVEPTAVDVLKMGKNELQNMLSFKIVEGDFASKKNSKFMGFAARVHKIQDVLLAYKQLKYRFPDATHIMCAYRIMDPDVVHFQDCADDGEFGAGRRILQMMEEQSYKNCVAFAVRHHDGPNIGPIRFNMIVDVAKSALQMLPSSLEQMIANGPPQNNDQGFTFCKQPITISTNTRSQSARSRGASTAARRLSFPAANYREAVDHENTPARAIRSVDV